jgi:large subunit ribosomal protein L21
MKYAIIRSGARQFRCVEGATIEVDRLPVQSGAAHTFADVLLIANDGSVTVGTPTIAGAAVNATVIDEFRAPKVIAYRYKAKERQRKKRGHREYYTRLLVNSIEG